MPVFFAQHREQIHHFHVAPAGKRVVAIPHIGEAAAHARREIPPGRAENHDAAAGHVFAAVIADAFHNGLRAAVADGEPLADHAAQVQFAVNRAVQNHIAGDDVFFRRKHGAARRHDDDFAAG